MRRNLFVLLLVCATMFTAFSCQRWNALRVVRISSPYYADLVDYAIERDPETGEPIEIEVIPKAIAEVAFQYVEIGPGLPTWTPYQAHIEKARITLRRIGGDELIEPLPALEVPCKVTVPADPTGKRVVFHTFELFSPWYIEEYLSGYDYLILEATVKFSGYDDATGRPIEATNKMEVSVSDFYDDPTRLGE